jgi:hypothetical protein
MVYFTFGAEIVAEASHFHPSRTWNRQFQKEDDCEGNKSKMDSIVVVSSSSSIIIPATQKRPKVIRHNIPSN